MLYSNETLTLFTRRLESVPVVQVELSVTCECRAARVKVALLTLHRHYLALGNRKLFVCVQSGPG